MGREMKTYLFLILALTLFWFTGSYVDSALWHHDTYRTPLWVSSHLDIIWLALSQAFFPLLIVFILKPRFNTIIAFISAACFGGVAWDLNYSFLTRGALVSSDSLLRWFCLDDFNFVIGIRGEDALLFHGARLLLGILFLIWLSLRIKKQKVK